VPAVVSRMAASTEPSAPGLLPVFDPLQEVRDLSVEEVSQGVEWTAEENARYNTCLDEIVKELASGGGQGEQMRCSEFKLRKDFIQSGQIHMTAKVIFLGPDCSLHFLPEVSAMVRVPACIAHTCNCVHSSVSCGTSSPGK
jgi:hypothetical protein